MAAPDTISSHLFLPVEAFSKVKGNKSVSPSATKMKENAATVSDAVSSAVNEKARKTIEMEARQVPGGLKKTIKNLTCLEDRPKTPHYPRWLEAIMRIAEFYPTLAMETVAHPVGKHLANNPSAVNVLKQEYDLNDIEVCSTAGAYDVSWEKQYKLFEIMRHCWDETAWAAVFENPEFVELVGKSGSPLCLVMLIFSQEKDDTLADGKNPALYSYLKSNLREGRIGGHGTLRECRAFSQKYLQLYRAMEFFLPRSSDSISVNVKGVFQALAHGLLSPVAKAMEQGAKVAFDTWVEKELADNEPITMTKAYAMLLQLLGSGVSSIPALEDASDGAQASGPVPLYEVHSVGRFRPTKRKGPNDSGGAGKKHAPAAPTTPEEGEIRSFTPRERTNLGWPPVDYIPPNMQLPKQCNQDWKVMGSCPHAKCYYTHTGRDGRPITEGSGGNTHPAQKPHPICWNQLCSTEGCSGFHCNNCGLTGHKADACPHQNRRNSGSPRGRGGGRGGGRGAGRGSGSSPRTRPSIACGQGHGAGSEGGV